MQFPTILFAALLAVAIAQPVAAQPASVADDGYQPPPVVSGNAYYTGQPLWTWQVGAEATYLSLEMRALEANSGIDLEIPFGFEAAPRIWLQAENVNGWGGQVRYWQYDADTAVSAVVSEVVTAGITTDIQVDQAATAELYTLDAEVTRAFQYGNFDLTASFGGRHAAIGSDNAVSFFVLAGPSLFQAGAVHRTDDFHGGGLTASLAGVLPLGESQWSLFGSVRGSALWGQEQRAATSTILAGGVVTSVSNSFAIDDATLGIFELQAGAQWEHPLAFGRGVLFARTAFEYQYWDATATLPPGPLDGESQLDADLYGISFAFGLER
jgi:hypothetical protein